MNLPLMFNPTVGLCRDDISKIDDENFMSRWRKNNQKINISCLIVPIPSKTTQLVDYSRLCNLFNIALGNLEYSNMKQFNTMVFYTGSFILQVETVEHAARL